MSFLQNLLLRNICNACQAALFVLHTTVEPIRETSWAYTNLC